MELRRFNRLLIKLLSTMQFLAMRSLVWCPVKWDDVFYMLHRCNFLHTVWYFTNGCLSFYSQFIHHLELWWGCCTSERYIVGCLARDGVISSCLRRMRDCELVLCAMKRCHISSFVKGEEKNINQGHIEDILVFDSRHLKLGYCLESWIFVVKDPMLKS